MAATSSPSGATDDRDESEMEKSKEQGPVEDGSSSSAVAAAAAVESPREPTESPGVQVTRGRIYDPAKGSTCHQCRQKTKNFSAPCKQMKRGKPCPIKYCHKCLLNRYGEKAEEVAAMEEWSCPKCRGVCNCSCCMKKRGHQPTGILIHTAKATGFSSVHELLDFNGSDVLFAAKGLRSLGTNNSPASEKKLLKRSHGKENSHDEEPPAASDDVNKELHMVKEKKRDLKKLKIETDDGDLIKPCGNNAGGKVNVQGKCPSKKSNAMQDRCNSIDEEKILDDVENQNGNVSHEPEPKEQKSTRRCIKSSFEHKNLETVLPQGTILTAVAGIDMAAEDIGAALQFLEFCNAFSKVLDIKEGEPQCILRDLATGHVGPRGVCTPVVKFHRKLLSLIQNNMEEEPLSESAGNEDSWLLSLVKCINESEHALNGSPLGCFDNGPLVYDVLSTSKKLKVLNLLCDRTLDTEKLRTCIDEGNTKFIERKKEARVVIRAAKKKDKEIKQRLKDEVAKSMISLRDKPDSSVHEHENLISQLKAENEKAHAEMIESMELIPKNLNKHRRDALRTQPLLWIGEGRVYWELEGHCSDSKILLQDIGSWDSAKLEDKWFSYNQEEEKTIETQISSLQKRRSVALRNLIKEEMEDDHAADDASRNPPKSPNCSSEEVLA